MRAIGALEHEAIDHRLPGGEAADNIESQQGVSKMIQNAQKERVIEAAEPQPR